MALSKYKKSLDYSYTLGVYPTLDLLKVRPDLVKTVILDPRTDANQGVKEIKALCAKHDIRFDYGNRIFKLLAIKDNTYVIGVFKKFETSIDRNANHVVLVNPSDTGNVGTIIRAMLGFGVKNLAIIKPAVDVFDPKVVRATMGSLFGIKYEYFESFEQYKEMYSENIIYPFTLAAKNMLQETKFSQPFSLVFGTEGAGLDKEFESHPNCVKIKHAKEIDSLNLSMAASIALYEATKDNVTSM